MTKSEFEKLHKHTFLENGNTETNIVLGNQSNPILSGYNRDK